MPMTRAGPYPHPRLKGQMGKTPMSIRPIKASTVNAKIIVTRSWSCSEPEKERSSCANVARLRADAKTSKDSAAT